MLLDHSIVFDGAYRVYLGQTLYKDFYAAYLPGTPWLQALAFPLLGVNFSAMVVPAALCNAFGAGIAMRIVWYLIPGSMVSAIVAGLLSAYWCPTPLGSLMQEQSAFFFALLAVWLLVEFESWPGKFLAGLACVATLLCKQNAGVLFAIPCTPILAVQLLPDWRSAPRKLFPFVAGLGVSIGTFLAWVRFVSDWDGFVLHALIIPLSIADGRFPKEPLQLIYLLATLDSPLRYVRAAAGIRPAVSLTAVATPPNREHRVTRGVLGLQPITSVTAFRRWGSMAAQG
jgi:hypothetical protein